MFRSASTRDLELLLTAQQTEPVAIVDADRFRRELDLHQYRLEWSWLHEADGKLLARALWWGPPDARHPISLDCVWVDKNVSDPVSLISELIDVAHRTFQDAGLEHLPDMNITVPTDWNDNPEAVVALTWRTAAVEATGLTERIERLSYAWTTGASLPPRSSRVTFTSADDQGFLDVFQVVAQGSLDLLTIQTLADMGPQAQAADDLEFYLSLPGNRDSWRIAFDATGHRIGFIIPSRSAYDASVSYLGVEPDYRGQGYVNDFLAEITHTHVAAGATKITGTTDTTNAPMAAAFLRGGYHITEARIVISAPHV